MDFEPMDIHQRMVELGEAWADAQAAADLLEEGKKSIISQLAADSNETSMSAKESWAIRQQSYTAYYIDMVSARKEANKAKVRYDAYKVYAELIRTKNANERAAMRSAP